MTKELAYEHKRDATVSPLDALVKANVGSKDDDLQPGRDHERSESSCPV